MQYPVSRASRLRDYCSWVFRILRGKEKFFFFFPPNVFSFFQYLLFFYS